MSLEEMVREAQEKEAAEPKQQKKSHRKKNSMPEQEEAINANPDIEIVIDEDMALTFVQMGLNVALTMGGLRQVEDVEEIAGARPFAQAVVGRYAKFFGKYINEIMLGLVLMPVIAGRQKEKREKEEEKDAGGEHIRHE